ncbi:MAG: hypothetical protein Q8N28_00530 [bacterium]|nr:hypothetical protein [bacterium]
MASVSERRRGGTSKFSVRPPVGGFAKKSPAYAKTASFAEVASATKAESADGSDFVQRSEQNCMHYLSVCDKITI